MTIKDILVHMDSGERAAIRLDLAITLARRFDARVFGLFAQVERSAPSLVARKASDALKAAGARAEAMFLEKTEAAGVRAKWQALAQGEYSFVIRETIICARFADLVILGQHDREHDGALVPDELPEQVILHSGRPVLMVPYAGEFTDAGRRVMVAWNAGRESARAVHDSLPFLATADEVRILAVHPRREADAGDAVPQVNIVEHLACHKVEARLETLAVEDIGIMDLILSRAADDAMDMIVMGAHGHYGFPYLHRGGGTRHILRNMTVPVLLAH